MEGGKVESSRDDWLKGEWERWEVKKDIQRTMGPIYMCTHTDTHTHTKDNDIYFTYTHFI